MGELEKMLRSLLLGNFSSLTIGFNDYHAANYVTAEGWRDEYGFYTGGKDDVIDWVSEEDRLAAIANNSVWTAQWYPETPNGFHVIGASSLEALLSALREATP
jgi:hypothetical protein